MKILMLASATPHSSLTHRPLAIGRELAELGHTVVMYAPASDKHSRYKLDQPQQIDGVQFRYPRQLKTKNQLLDLIPYIIHGSWMVMRERPDVVYIYKPTPASVIGLLAGWFGKSRIVLDMDDLGSEVMQAQNQPALMSWLVGACERLAARSASAFTGASRLLTNEYTSKYPTKPVLRVPNGVNPEEFPLAPKPAHDRAPRIVFFGILGRTRILAPLLRSLPDVVSALGSEAVQVEILGDGPCRSELEELAKDLGVASNVHFRGWVTYDQLPNYAARDDIGICIMPNERTTAACSNQKVFQYMAMGLTTIVSETGDLPLYVDNGSAGTIVPNDDPAALAETLIRLLTNDDARATLAKRGRKFAAANFNWSHLAGDVNTLLETVK